eukprot:gene4443-4195_t
MLVKMAAALKPDLVDGVGGDVGTNIHADRAAVNINFWITPDHCNRDPAHGGIEVWRRVPPQRMDATVYNNEAGVRKLREFLAGEGSTVIPHRRNRMVVFDSALFHKTDTLDFKPGYRCRRISITFLPWTVFPVSFVIVMRTIKADWCE